MEERRPFRVGRKAGTEKLQAYFTHTRLVFFFPTTARPLGKYRPPKIQILLTKCDLVKRIDLARRVAFVRQQLEEVMRGCQAPMQCEKPLVPHGVLGVRARVVVMVENLHEQRSVDRLLGHECGGRARPPGADPLADLLLFRSSAFVCFVSALLTTPLLLFVPP